ERTSARPLRSRSPGGVPSWPSRPWTPSAGALRGSPLSTTTTDRRERPSWRAPLRPAGPPPITTTSTTPSGRSSGRSGAWVMGGSSLGFGSRATDGGDDDVAHDAVGVGVVRGRRRAVALSGGDDAPLGGVEHRDDVGEGRRRRGGRPAPRAGGAVVAPVGHDE